MTNQYSSGVCCKMRNILKLSKLQTTKEEGAHHSRPQIFNGNLLPSIRTYLKFSAGLNCNLTSQFKSTCNVASKLVIYG